jgi:hypothetical protein
MSTHQTRTHIHDHNHTIILETLSHITHHHHTLSHTITHTLITHTHTRPHTITLSLSLSHTITHHHHTRSHTITHYQTHTQTHLSEWQSGRPRCSRLRPWRERPSPAKTRPGSALTLSSLGRPSSYAKEQSAQSKHTHTQSLSLVCFHPSLFPPSFRLLSALFPLFRLCLLTYAISNPINRKHRLSTEREAERDQDRRLTQ